MQRMHALEITKGFAPVPDDDGLLVVLPLLIAWCACTRVFLWTTAVDLFDLKIEAIAYSRSASM